MEFAGDSFSGLTHSCHGSSCGLVVSCFILLNVFLSTSCLFLLSCPFFPAHLYSVQSHVFKPVFYPHTLLVHLCFSVLSSHLVLPMFAASVSCVSSLVLMCSLSFCIFSLWLSGLCTQFLHFFFSFSFPGFLLHRLCCISVHYMLYYRACGAWQKVCVLVISYDTEITFSLNHFVYSYKILQNVVSCISMYSYQHIYCNMSFQHCSTLSRW